MSPARLVPPRRGLFAWPRILWLALALAVLLVIALGMISNIIVDWLWFDSLGYRSIFVSVLGAKAAVFFAFFVVTTGLVWLSGAIAARAARPPAYLLPANSPWAELESDRFPAVIERFVRRLPWTRLAGVAALVIGLMVALGWIPNWSLALSFLDRSSYGVVDPVFGNDLGFYLFTLPLLDALKAWLLVVLFFSAALAGVIYWVSGEIVIEPQRRYVSGAAAAHALVLLAVFFVIEAWGFLLARYLLLYGDNGVVVGASYTDVHIALPILGALAVLSVLAALASLLNLRWHTWRIPIASIIVVFGTAWVISPLLSGIAERFYVKPNELRLEAPYLKSNIRFTREAYALGRVVVKPFTADETLTAQSLDENRATVDNIRLWDWQPLLASYAQLQEIRTYYKFHDADIDRYQLGRDGSDQQVMLSARELDASLLPANAQTWVNLHLLFTHGNGVVMSPVTKTTTEGLPLLYIQDIPPVSTGGPRVTEPRIYFGEADAPYAIVKGTTPEFDYPRGSDNVYRSYDGKDGIPFGDIARRLLFAWNYGDLNILLSQYIDRDSRILIRRNIQARVRALAPFLSLDHDPYIVISGGHLFWIQDAYTASSWFPYAQPLEDGSADYVRNSVKVVIDAYNGTTVFYLADPSDPLVRTWQKIFPQLFKPISAMPADLRRHVRYPEDLFLLQAQIYRAYHMAAPEVFYNREDLWQFPRQPTDLEDDSETDSKMAPYYINMRLPGESRTEFVLMLPMVPASRENMIAWLAARCDQTDYGRLIVYEFPKEKLIYGPYQIEALINQNTEVSQQLTLWNQSGSRVLRGNLLVVPIGNSVLYVTPLYLRAQSGQLPELKRVIAIYRDKVVMRESLTEALAALFGTVPGMPPPQAGASKPLTSIAPLAASDRAREALEHYNRAITDLKAGDWAGFGTELDALRPLLQQLGAGAPLDKK